MSQRIILITLILFLCTGCKAVDLDMPVPQFETGIDPESWENVPAGEFYYGQHGEIVDDRLRF